MQVEIEPKNIGLHSECTACVSLWTSKNFVTFNYGVLPKTGYLERRAKIARKMLTKD